MSEKTRYREALGRLREAAVLARERSAIREGIIAKKDQVLARFQPVFSLSHVDDLGEEEFKSFLYPENNRHWSGLYRLGLKAADDMPRLRSALRRLLDESQPIAARFTDAAKRVPGMGKAIASAILTVAYPERYGVWNSTSETGMRVLGIWPEFPRGAALGERYAIINESLGALAMELEVDFWTLDALWWAVLKGEELPAVLMPENVPPAAAPGDGVASAAAGRFALEEQLEDFLVTNWDQTVLGRDWAIYVTDDDEGAGQQFPSDIGRIDILARHRREPRWLVIELKRHQTSDDTVGQVLRYMGWVRRHLAAENEAVEGLVVAHGADKKVQYALDVARDVRLMFYEVHFELRPAQSAGGRT